jgi:hypothetical protein
MPLAVPGPQPRSLLSTESITKVDGLHSIRLLHSIIEDRWRIDHEEWMGQGAHRSRQDFCLSGLIRQCGRFMDELSVVRALSAREARFFVSEAIPSS